MITETELLSELDRSSPQEITMSWMDALAERHGVPFDDVFRLVELLSSAVITPRSVAEHPPLSRLFLTLDGEVVPPSEVPRRYNELGAEGFRAWARTIRVVWRRRDMEPIR